MFTGLVAQASNIKRDNDVQYSKSEFLDYYPQFSNLVPDTVLGGF